MLDERIAILGAGNMGSAIAKGLIYTKSINAAHLHITDKRKALFEELSLPGIVTGSSNPEAVKGATIVILAVKPQHVRELFKELKRDIMPGTIVVSLAAGVESCALLELSGGNNPVFRVMPNTAIAIGQSMTCISGANHLPQHEERVMSLFGKLGTAMMIPEEQMAGATVLASCGTAFALKYIRAATQGGVQIGFNNEMALKMVAQTVIGAAHLVAGGKAHPEKEIDKVTTPGGITIAGLNEMEHEGFSSSVIKAHITSFRRMGGDTR